VTKAEVLDRLYAAYAGQLVLQRVADGKRLVRGAGPLDAPLVVVGEAPGEAEDRHGEPFVGPSGQLLQHLFARAGLPWELCYRTNVLPWRPPGNRTPDNFEIVASYNRVEQEIAVIGPLVVVAAGSTAWQAVTRNKGGRFTDAVGNWIEGRLPYRLLPVYHPAFILRSSGAERDRLEAVTVAVLHSALAASGA
jgi:uracil-DNA glycosylase family 4